MTPRGVMSGLRQLCFWVVLGARTVQDLCYCISAPQLLNSITSISATERILLTTEMSSKAVGGPIALAQLTSLIRLAGIFDLIVVLGTGWCLGPNNAGLLVCLMSVLVQLNVSSGLIPQLETLSRQLGYTEPVFGPWDTHAMYVQAGMALVIAFALVLPTMRSATQPAKRESNPFGSLLIFCCVVTHAALALAVMTDQYDPTQALMFDTVNTTGSFSPLGVSLTKMAGVSLAVSLIGMVLLFTVPSVTSGSLVVLMLLHSVLGVRAYLFSKEEGMGEGGMEGMMDLLMSGNAPVYPVQWMYAHFIVASLGFLALVTLPTDDEKHHEH